jgi:hypothetical protein
VGEGGAGFAFAFAFYCETTVFPQDLLQRFNQFADRWTGVDCGYLPDPAANFASWAFIVTILIGIIAVWALFIAALSQGYE